MRITHARLFASTDGESHFEDMSADLLPTDFAPPAPPLDLSAPRTATAGTITIPWDGRDGAGLTVPAGSYRLTGVAVDPA